jgi:RNA polymerase sigma factor (sigma-70 family)
MLRTKPPPSVRSRAPLDVAPEASGCDETALMVRFRERRGPEEFHALYEGTRDGLLAWISGQVRLRGLAEDPADLLQDTFVNIYRYPAGFRDERASSFRVWSRRIATNVCRRAASRTSTLRMLPSDPELPQDPADPRCGPGDHLSRAEEAASLVRAWMLLLAFYAASLRNLQPREQAALELVELDDRSYADAARILRVGRSNMKMIVFRARKRMRAEIARRLGSPTESGRN